MYKNREEFLSDLVKFINLNTSELKSVLKVLGKRDETADICTKKNGEPELDASLRDTEVIPLKEDVEDYLKREVYPHVPDAIPDMDNVKIGYEIPFNKLFYVYEPPRPLEEIEQELQSCEEEIIKLCSEMMA